MALLRQTLAYTLVASFVLPPVAHAGPAPDEMSQEERLEVAKSLYGEGDAAFKSGDFAEALAKFEEAYNAYAPSFHVFNINIGLAAFQLGDCIKARTAFQRFLDLVPDHPARAEAQQKLLEIERSKCAETQQAEAEEPAPISTPQAPATDDEEAPVLTSRSQEREEAIEREREQIDAKKVSPMLISGATLTALGGAALIGGAVSAVLAKSKADELAELASPGTTGFPQGNYANDDVFNLDRNGLPNNNAATVALLVGGGALAATGAALLAVHFVRKKKAGQGGTNARLSQPRLISAGPSVLRGGAGASAAWRF